MMESANNIMLVSSGSGGSSSSPYSTNHNLAQAATTTIETERAMELSLTELSPLTGSIWSYTGFMATNLFLWVVYLLLPKGFRKQFCRASRKRYIRRKDVNSMPAGGYWLPASKTLSTVSNNTGSVIGHGGRGGDVDRTSHHLRMRQQQGQRGGQHVPEGELLDLQNHNSSGRGGNRQFPGTPDRKGFGSGGNKGKEPPSPEHPALKRIPPNKIIAETMGRLQGRGIRLMAHGVQCEPKRVWIKLDDETTSVTWQTEFPRRVPNQAGGVSIVLMRGSLHRIALCNVLYIDVGKKTKALMRPENDSSVQDTTCFSLLTQNGSLDLQANSRLERDALVACFSMILDDVHTEDWRSLYEASPDPSLVTTTTSYTGGTGEEEEIGTEVAYNSDLMVEV